MKKKLLMALVCAVSACTVLSGCSSYGSSSYKSSGAMSSEGLANGSSVNGYGDFVLDPEVDGGYYASYDSADTKKDYSYSFKADGNTKLTRQGAVAFLDELDAFATEKGGYISDVRNNWTDYDVDEYGVMDTYYDSDIRMHSDGSLSFTVYVPNEDTFELTNKLQEFCDKNGLTVTGFTQSATSYQGYRIEDDDWIDEYGGRYDAITQEELDNRLATSTYSVSLRYHEDRGFFGRAARVVHNIIAAALDALIGLLGQFVPILTMVAIPSVAIVLVYRGCTVGSLKARYKLYKKYPEYFEVPCGREIRITNLDEVRKAVTAKSDDSAAVKVEPVAEKKAEPVAEKTESSESTESTESATKKKPSGK